MYQKNKFRIIKEGIVLVDYGPITMSIKVESNNKPITNGAIKAAESVIENFEQLIPFLKIARSPIGEIKLLHNSNYPTVLSRMIRAVSKLNEDSFTPMAAVAGTFADLAREEALKYKADFVIINNGGDISFQTPINHNSIKVAIVSDLSIGKITHLLKINNTNKILGIATSGWGGRSLTKGVASAVTVLAKDSSYADAAATAIANATNCNDDSIERCLAEEIDYGTDIEGEIVTRKVGKMKEENILLAIEAGRKRAKELYDKKMILGAIIFAQGKMSLYPKESEDFYISKICNNP